MDIENNITRAPTRDAMNNELPSTTDSTNVQTNIVTIQPTRGVPATYNDCYSTNSESDSPGTPEDSTRFASDHHSIASAAFAHDTIVQNMREVEIGEPLHIPIVGYEVMEERARFTIYKLKVEDAKTKRTWLVFRRYTDFVRLYSRIKAERPSVSLPLPGKRWFRDNFEPVFLEERVRGLQIFVNSIVKRLPNNPRVREFFCLDEPPQIYNYQPEVQAVCGALEDSVGSLKTQLKQKDATILYLQRRVASLEALAARCDCSKSNSC